MNPVTHSISPRALITSLTTNRALLFSMAWREVRSRYMGSTAGLLWSVATPLLMLVVYTAVFGGIFKSRWGGTGSTVEFALQLFCGLTLHALLSECLTRAPGKLLEHANYVKKVVFPLDILPVITVLGALFNAVIGVGILVVASVIIHGTVPLSLIAIPLVLMPLILLCLGVSWFLAATTVYLRDLNQITGLLSTVLLFLAPVFYPVSMIPPLYQPLMRINPLTIPIEQLRLVIDGQWPSWSTLGIYGLFGLVVAYLGYAWFQKIRKGFADVL